MAIIKKKISPRQKMINLLYVVLMAMLAINVSSEVLDAFVVVEDSMARTLQQTERENKNLYDTFERQNILNHEKAGVWYDKAQQVRKESQQLYALIDTIKSMIVKEADGKDAKASLASLENKEQLDAAAKVMMAPGRIQYGQRLFQAIKDYRTALLSMTDDSTKRQVIENNLSTKTPHNAENKDWVAYYFESTPAAAAITMLTKLQSDVRYTEGQMLHTLMNNIDAKDVRVNTLQALVIPNSRTIIRGNAWEAQIVMAAMDTTQKPRIFIGGKETPLHDGMFRTVCNTSGEQMLKGWMEITGEDGEILRRPFEQRYTVVEPWATVSSNIVNVLYAGYDNPLSVSVPGVALKNVKLTMNQGTLTQKAPGQYIAKPTKAGEKVTVTVFSTAENKIQQMGQFEFRVRQLPAPAPYIVIRDEKGNGERFRGGGINKSALANVTELKAAIDDGIMDVPFKVTSFETVFFDRMGNAVPVTSDGAHFSERQKETYKKLSKGRRFYISRIQAVGPDNIQRTLNTSMEVIIR